jgi:enoyl-CoA hydratase
MTTDLRPIHIERSGQVATLKMRHGKANALDVVLCGALAAALDEVERDGAEAVVLTGTGSIFSAGVDLRQVLDGGAPYVRELLPALRQTFERLAFFERPLVAAVNGHAIAGGFILLAAADQAIMTTGTARAGVTELRVGVPFPTIALELLRLRVGDLEVARLAYRGTTLMSEQALARGLVDELAGPDRVLETAVRVASEMAAAGAAFRVTKRQIRRPLRQALAGDVEDDDARVDALWRDEAALAAMRRYAESVLGRPASS